MLLSPYYKRFSAKSFLLAENTILLEKN